MIVLSDSSERGDSNAPEDAPLTLSVSHNQDYRHNSTEMQGVHGNRQGNCIKMNMHYNEHNINNLNITTETQRAQRKIFHFLGNVEFHFDFGFRDKQFHPFVRHSRKVLP